MSSSTRLQLEAVYGRGDFEQPGGDYEDLVTALEFIWELSPRLSVNLTFNRSDRSSDRPDGEYLENRFWISLGYGRGQPRAEPLQPEFAIDAVTPANVQP